MPISGPSSYLPTIEQFLSHWDEVNLALGSSGPLILPGGEARAVLTGMRDQLEGARDTVSDDGVDRSVARAQLNALIATLQGRMVEFNARVRGDLAGHPLADALGLAFAVGDGEASVRDGLRRMSRLWSKVDALAPPPPGLNLPMVLTGGFGITQLDAARDGLRDAYRALSDAEVELDVARGQRDRFQNEVYPILKEYRQKVTGLQRQFPELVATLPALTPPDGHTPAPVSAQGVWDGPGLLAKITWSVSAEADLREYQVRGVPGDTYVTEDEIVLATVPSGGVREVETGFGLGSPGLTAGFKVYVVLHTGNERGSEAAFVTRPG